MKSSDDFYVGYLPEMPISFKRFLQRTIGALFGISLLIGLVAAIIQKRFSTNDFDYGKGTAVKGFIHFKPAPYLVVSLGTDTLGNELLESILLVGKGKHGAMTSMNENLPSLPVDGSYVEINGSLIYGDGKALLEINELSTIVADEKRKPQRAALLEPRALVTGEVIDPKCYFGVMNPGEGKPHRSCAIRCISGGIPAVLKSENDYYLLTDESLKPLREEVLGIVGDRMNLTGEVLLIDQWKVLKVNKKEIELMVNVKRFRQQFDLMQEGMTLCRVFDENHNE